MKVEALDVRVDSKLVASQVNGEFVAAKESMIRYPEKVKQHVARFKSFKIRNIPRAQNHKAYVLSKLASIAFDHLTKEVLVEVLSKPSIDEVRVNAIVEEEEDNWMMPIIKCLEEGIWPKDPNEARNMRKKIPYYTIEDGVLFKKSYLDPMLRCVGPLQANYIIREVYEGACGMHSGPISVVAKLIRQGYYWPTIHKDARE